VKVSAISKSVAVMQPYFYPYPAYFALLAAVETFVIYDCVQFPRRGRVHRSEVGRRGQQPIWLTLPLLRQSRATLIRDLEFAPDATSVFRERLGLLANQNNYDRLPEPVRRHLTGELSDVVGFLHEGLHVTAALLGLTPRIVRSSSLSIDPALHGQERIIAIAEALGADRYVNASGGRELYDPRLFARHGLRLEFLRPYQGDHWHMLPALGTVPLDDLANSIRASAATRDVAN
jgi:hypothetical protein